VWIEQLLWLICRVRSRRRVWWRIDDTIEPLTGEEIF
jgi:hypothetical protein